MAAVNLVAVMDVVPIAVRVRVGIARARPRAYEHRQGGQEASQIVCVSPPFHPFTDFGAVNAFDSQYRRDVAVTSREGLGGSAGSIGV